MTNETLLILSPVPAAVCLAITALRRRYHLREGARIDAATPLAGTIVADGADPVVELVLDLRIPHSQSGGMSVEETHRELHARPFRIHTDAGELIDVETPRDVTLHATLGKAQKLEHHRRYRKTARVRAGQRAYLVGTLREPAAPDGGPFREGESPRRAISPSLISTEMLGASARRAAENDKKWLKRWAVLTLLGPVPYALFLVPLFMLAFWIREMIVSPMWWGKTPYREWYSMRAQREDRAEYD